MDDPNITMEEYIILQTKNAQRHGQTFNYETATYGKVYCEDFNSFMDFEAYFPTIVYNDALTSYENVLSKPNVNMAPLPPRTQRYPWLRYQVEGYTKDIVNNFKQRLDMIFGRQVNRVHVLYFARLTDEMRGTLAGRLRMVYTGDERHELFTRHAWRRLFKIWGLLVREFILEFFSTSRRRMTGRQCILALGLHTAKEMAEDGFEAYWLGSTRVIPDKGILGITGLRFHHTCTFWELPPLMSTSGTL
ncbi:hypothetical protein Tco_0246870 [Tanacetum coccineum]